MKEINMETIILENKIKNFKAYLLVIIILLFQTDLHSYENKIIFKIDNEIITNLDLENEIIYLTALNPNLKKLDKAELIQISRKSLIQEKIKKIEIQKNFKSPKISEEFLKQLLKNIYSRIGIESLDNFKKYLSLNQINYDEVLQKIEIEALWNELIIVKFSKKIKIDQKQLEKEIKKNINNEIKTYLMSEIFFEVKIDETVQNKYQKIITSIKQIGFENTALKYSISETSKIGGRLDWINENSLNKKIKELLNTKKINEFTKPITVPGGFLILKINDIKITKSEKNIDNELQKLIQSTRNNQLNQFSKLYFNKVKENVEINEI